jgi:Rod binding domain-containing protein
MPAASLAAAPPETGTALPSAQVAKTWKAAQDFEAMALGEMLRPIFDTVDSAHGPFGGGDGEAQFRPMLVDAMARGIATHGGVGIAPMVFRQMIQAQEGKP